VGRVATDSRNAFKLPFKEIAYQLSAREALIFVIAFLPIWWQWDEHCSVDY